MQVIELDHVQIAIPVGGEALAREFYAGILGMPELPKPVLMQLRGGAWFACGDRQIHLGAEVNFQPAKKAHPAFIVRDLDALCALLRTTGYAVLKNEELYRPGGKVSMVFSVEAISACSLFAIEEETKMPRCPTLSWTI